MSSKGRGDYSSSVGSKRRRELPQGLKTRKRKSPGHNIREQVLCLLPGEIPMGKETSYWLEEGGANIFLLVLGKRLDDSVFGLEKEPPRYRLDG